MSSSQLTKSMIFQRGGEKRPTSIIGIKTTIIKTTIINYNPNYFSDYPITKSHDFSEGRKTTREAPFPQWSSEEVSRIASGGAPLPSPQRRDVLDRSDPGELAMFHRFDMDISPIWKSSKNSWFSWIFPYGVPILFSLILPTTFKELGFAWIFQLYFAGCPSLGKGALQENELQFLAKQSWLLVLIVFW